MQLAAIADNVTCSMYTCAQVTERVGAVAAARGCSSGTQHERTLAMRVEYVKLRTKLEMAGEQAGVRGPSAALVLGGKDAQSLVVGSQGFQQLDSRCRLLERQLTNRERLLVAHAEYQSMVGDYFVHEVRISGLKKGAYMLLVLCEPRHTK